MTLETPETSQKIPIDPTFSSELNSLLVQGELSIRLIGFTNAVFKEDLKIKLVQTRPYRAPEVIMRLIHGPPCDIWSLGCTVYRLLTGEHLFPIRCNITSLRNEEHLFAIFELCKGISKTHIHSSSLRKKLLKILTRVREFPAVYKRKSVRGLLVQKFKLNEDEVLDLVRLINSSLEFVPSNRKSAELLLKEFHFSQVRLFSDNIDLAAGCQSSDWHQFLVPQMLKSINDCQLGSSVTPVCNTTNKTTTLNFQMQGPSTINTSHVPHLLKESDRQSKSSHEEMLPNEPWDPLKLSEQPDTSLNELSVSDISHADFEDFDPNQIDAPNRLFNYQQGRRFESGIHNFEELRKTCDRSFIHNSLYIGHDIGINVDCIDVRDEIDSEERTD